MFTGTLSANAQNALAILGKNNLPPDTYLAGGSALALLFGHRLSLDFDFFTPRSFNYNDVAKQLKKIGNFNMARTMKDTLLGEFNGVKFSLFRYEYPVLYKTHSFFGIELADPRDIAAMKIAAVMDRGTKKDFIDLYFLSKKGTTLDSCLKYYDKKYGVLASNLYSIITSLSYFTQAEDSDMPEMLEMVSWSEIKKYFEKEAIRLAKKFL